MTAKKSGNSLYTIKYLKSIRKDISAFPETVKLRIKNAIRGRVATAAKFCTVAPNVDLTHGTCFV